MLNILKLKNSIKIIYFILFTIKIKKNANNKGIFGKEIGNFNRKIGYLLKEKKKELFIKEGSNCMRDIGEF